MAHPSISEACHTSGKYMDIIGLPGLNGVPYALRTGAAAIHYAL